MAFRYVDPWMKENKYFTPVSFWLPVLYLMILGLFFNEQSSYTSVLHRSGGNTEYEEI
jgi:hypothetical protein